MQAPAFEFIDGPLPRYEWGWGRLRAAFTLRSGGVSAAPYDSLNLARHVGEQVENVEENRRRVAEALRLKQRGVRTVSQVHGTRVVPAAMLGSADGECAVVEADGIVVARDERAAVAVLTADCVPLVLAGSEHAAVVHAGWRGLAAGVVEQALGEVGGARVRAAIGPSIGPCCFEVGPEVAALMSPSSATMDQHERIHVDLRHELVSRLLAAGIVTEVLDVCTSCDRRLFSHRRATTREDRPGTGRQAALAWFEA